MDTEQNEELLKERFRLLLQIKVCTVTFKKVNGDIRVMDCTLNSDLIPPSQWPHGEQIKESYKNNKTIRVYDIKAQGWRSFVIENVVEIT